MMILVGVQKLAREGTEVLTVLDAVLGVSSASGDLG